MEKKLTIEHLAPYLPYGLKIMRPDGKTVLELHGIAGDLLIFKEEDETYGSILGGKSKPLLLPLSELNKPLMCKGEPSFIPASRYDLKLHDGQWCDIHYAEYGGSPIAYAPICDINTWMFKYHFDVFSLIPQNLAIDKRTIK